MKKVLVVDDVEICRYTIAVRAEELGFSYKGASTIEDALELLKADRYDYLFLDYHVKKNKISDHLDDIIKLAGSECHICLMSAIEDDKAQELLVAGKAKKFIKKPVDQSDLTKVLGPSVA